MRWNHVRATAVTILALLAILPSPATAQTLQAPEGWIARPERFVEMYPGWHITAGRGVILYNPEATARGEFRVESEGFLFDPRGTGGTYGLILGGRELDTNAQRYIAFEIGPDGDFTVRRQADYESSELAGGIHEAIHSWTGEDSTVMNVLSVDAGAVTVRFRVNDDTVAELPRPAVDPDGVIGFRIDSDLNIHITTLDITDDAGTKSWAPKPPEE
jgi:hypothetical protein